jgi:hypothetical protein
MNVGALARIMAEGETAITRAYLSGMAFVSPLEGTSAI